MCELFGFPDSGAKSAVLGFPQVEHLFKTAHQAGFWIGETSGILDSRRPPVSPSPRLPLPLLSKMLGILAVLSVSAAAGMRVALPLLVIGLTQRDLWNQVPVINLIPAPLVIGILVPWAVLELFISKQIWGQRVLQLVELVFSPVLGGIMAMAAAIRFDLHPDRTIWIMSIVGGLFALLLQLVRVGWFYRLQGLPTWAVILEDILCVLLVLFAFKAPNSGGLIALLLLWLAIRSSQSWYRWHKGG